MKVNYAARDSLYELMDGLIRYYNDNNYKLPWITLDCAQYKVFTDFNEKKDGEYCYRNIKVRRQYVR